MEHFRRLGFADEIRAQGLPDDYPTDIAYFTRYCGRELARFRLPPSNLAPSMARSMTGSWSAAELPHRISQKFVEVILRRHAGASSLATVNYGWRLNDFTEHANRIVSTVENVETGEIASIESEYLVGADGPRSTVRQQLGIRYSGESDVRRDFFGGKMIAIYLRSSRFYEVVAHGRAWMYWAFNPQRRSWLAAVNGKDEFAFHTQLKSGEDDVISEARARELLAQAMGRPLDAELLAIDTWIAGHSLVADDFGRDRVFIAGDSAHLFTPAGGLGYNTAVEDAVNLGWKLAAAIKGNAGPLLLPSYGVERRKLALRNTGYARQLAESIGNFAPSPAIESEGPEGDAARSTAADYLNAHARREFDIPGVTFGGRYDGSPVIFADGETLPEDSANRYHPTASPGGRLPHMWLADGRSVYDILGFEWTLLAMGPNEAAHAAFQRIAAARGIELTIVVLETAEARALYRADCVLVRPDQIVAWRGCDADLDGERILGRALGDDTIAVSRRDDSKASAQ